MTYKLDERTTQLILHAINTYPTMKQACNSLNMYFGTFKKLATELGVFKPNIGGKGVPSEKRMSAEQIMVKGVNRHREHLVRALEEKGIKYQCALCHLDPTWNKQPLTLDVDHIDGDHSNNEFSNLRFLCPNCHSQTPTNGFKRRHSEKTKRKISKRLKKSYAQVAKLVTACASEAHPSG